MLRLLITKLYLVGYRIVPNSEMIRLIQENELEYKTTVLT
jgi:hypothetical protein